MLVSLVSYSTDGINFSLIKGTKKVKLVFDNVDKGQTLLIKSQRGEVLHKEEILHEGTIYRVFDFSDLKIGNYEIDIDKESEILRKPFVINSSSVIFKKDEITLISKPVIKLDKDILSVSGLDTTDKELSVKILFKGKEIFAEDVSSKSSRLYKLDKFAKGDYTVFVKTQGKVFTEEFVF